MPRKEILKIFWKKFSKYLQNGEKQLYLYLKHKHNDAGVLNNLW